MIAKTYDDPDETEPSGHDELREERMRWFCRGGRDGVVDIEDSRIVTVWRMGYKP